MDKRELIFKSSANCNDAVVVYLFREEFLGWQKTDQEE
tara:strand:- start:115 stop:228 length:114 start_codon:yes stop_codon:yes gene_type:complete